MAEDERTLRELSISSSLDLVAAIALTQRVDA